MTTGPEAGYYADPSIPGYIRYWDGAQWVSGTSRPASAETYAEPVAQPAPAQPALAWAAEPVRESEYQPTPDHGRYAAEPEPVREYIPEPAQNLPSETVATMVVPSAFGGRGGYNQYNQDWSGASPFAAIPGLHAQEEPGAAEPAEPEIRVVELASAGSRVLARIIDSAIAALLSAPATVTLLLIAHRHDHAYVQQLRLQAKTTYRALGMDTVGIGLWAVALLVVLVTATGFEAVRVGRSGQTTGRRLVGVRVVRADTAGRVSGGAALTRAVTFWLFALLPLVDVVALGGVLWGRPYRQGMHEKLSRTITIDV